MPVRFFNHYIHLSILLLGAIEAAIFVASVYIGALIRFSGDTVTVEQSVGPLLPRALLYAFIMILSLMAMGLYRSHMQATRAGILVRVAASFVLGGAVLALVFYVFPGLYLGRGAFALVALSSFFFVAAARLIFFRVVDEDIFKRRVLVYGAGERARSLTRLRRRTDRRAFNIVGFVPTGSDETEIQKERLLEVNPSLLNFCRQTEVDEIVVALDDRRKKLPVNALLECKLGGVGVSDALTFLERETGRVDLKLLYPSWFIFSEGFRRGTMRSYLERVFDVIASFIILLATWPIMLFASLAIVLEDGIHQPVFYRQRRVGYEGAIFDVLKFRSMRTDAEKSGKPVWASKGDLRVTRVGRFIRKYRIDELPQILNVLRGDMSFVGPRPERPEFVEKLSKSIPFYRERHCVKPGITGWAQLSYPYAASESDAVEKLQYDLYYVKHHSLLFDLVILLQTAEVVLWGHGSR